MWYHKQRLVLSNNNEVSSEPKLDSFQNFAIFHWDLNSITAHNFSIKNSFKSIYDNSQNWHCIFVWNLSWFFIPSKWWKLCLSTTNPKHGEVYIYYKTFEWLFPLKIIDIQYFQECIHFQLIIGDKICHFIMLYQSSNQSHDEFSLFIKNLEFDLNKATTYNSFLVIVLGDFNAKSWNWCIDDKANFERTKADTITPLNDLQQIIKELTHILDTSSSCIDLFFTSQHRLVMDSGLHAFSYVNFYHQISSVYCS